MAFHFASSPLALLFAVSVLVCPVSNPVLVEASDGPSVSNFSSSVLGDDERVVVLWSLTATS